MSHTTAIGENSINCSLACLKRCSAAAETPNYLLINTIFWCYNIEEEVNKNIYGAFYIRQYVQTNCYKNCRLKFKDSAVVFTYLHMGVLSE